MATKHKGLREREGYWHYRIVLKGHPEYSGSTGLAATTQNVKAALKIRNERLEQIAAGISKTSKPIAFPEAASVHGVVRDGVPQQTEHLETHQRELEFDGRVLG